MNPGPELFAALENPAHGWSMGSFGAIAEFHRTPAEALLRDAPGIKATAGGAIALRPGGARAVAFETLSPQPGRWSQSVALCLPAGAARMGGRAVLTRLGPDAGAVLPDHRGAVLYDMGLAQEQVDFCVRTDDPALMAVLDAACGSFVLAPGNPAMGAILAAHPHRVALTRLGRVEVFQKIGGPDTGGVSPPGPHTHVLPRLLASGRTHSANAPIPRGLVPCAGFHPASPISDGMGRPRPFDAAAAEAFDRWLSLWGAPDYVAARDSLRAALRAGLPAADALCIRRQTRLTRTAMRVALRQWAAAGGAVPQDWAALDRTAGRASGRKEHRPLC